VQLDCPEDVNTYIHRVGRTARYKAKGNALLFLLESEQAFLPQLEKHNIALKKLMAKTNHQLTI
jgi:ATP-dependent RNA helicase DDX10/DBP4